MSVVLTRFKTPVVVLTMLVNEIRRRPRYAVPTFGLLLFSSFGGLITWPPDSLVPYGDLIAITRIEDGIKGLLTRGGTGLFMLLCWLTPWTALRVVGYLVGTLCAGLLFVAFARAGYGDFAAQWAFATLCGLVAIVRDNQ